MSAVSHEMVVVDNFMRSLLLRNKLSLTINQNRETQTENKLEG
jgi:hypothetical protein